MMRLAGSDRTQHILLPAKRRIAGNSGLSLIELMLVLAILAVVSAIAYPTYVEQIRKSRRADAVSTLMDRAQVLERCFTLFNAYNAEECSDPEGASSDGFYQITVARTATTYTLTAAPTRIQASDRCGSLTLDYLGNKTPPPGINRCWGSS